MKEGRKCNKIVSLVLAAIMMVSVFAVSTPEQVQAAGELSFKGSGKSSVTISDDDCTYFTKNITYIKLKPTTTGYVSIKLSDKSNLVGATSGAPVPAFGSIALCSNNKKNISTFEKYDTTAGDPSWHSTRTFGVKKGKTYYVAVNSTGGVQVTATIKKATKGSNNSKGKAKKLPVNKKVNGLILAGENKADWYKISVTKQKQVKITLTGKTNGDTDYNGIKFTFYKKNGKTKYTSNASDHVSPVNPSTWYQALKINPYTRQEFGIDKGTYYIKVERYNKTSSGFYTLKWQYK